MEDVRHQNMLDANEQAYCHKLGEIVTLDGLHVAQQCWLCPLWAGLGNGDRVDCIYDDASARQSPTIYTKPRTAQAEAPQPVEDVSAISSNDSLAAMNARLKLVPQDEAPAAAEPAEEEMSDEEMQAAMDAIDNEGAEEAPAVPAKKQAPPKAPVK